MTLSIRTRLLIAYLGIVLAGFSALVLIVGGQIASAARQDYEGRLSNEIRLIAQGLSVENNQAFNPNRPETSARLTEYEAQVDGTLQVISLAMGMGDRRGPPEVDNLPEIEAALRGNITVVQRRDASGQEVFATAAVLNSPRPAGWAVQLIVPARNLDAQIASRWVMLGLIFSAVSALTLALVLLIARSIIRPLYALRESALRLSRGDLGHRVQPVTRDEIGQVAQAFNEMAAQVQSMLEEQRAFASNTSHELRTPLTTIRLRSEALRDDPTLDAATTQQYIAEIDDEVRRLGALIEDLALLSRFDAGRAELGATEIDLNRLAQSVLQQAQTSARAADIALTLTPAEAPVIVYASLNHLTVALRNLVENAIKYTPSGGHVQVSVGCDADGARLVIRDNGRGIDSTQLPHVFERFYRADKARSRDIPGSGLGLSLVQSIVAAYGGSISVTSGGLGKGTQAAISWPLADASTRR